MPSVLPQPTDNSGKATDLSYKAFVQPGKQSGQHVPGNNASCTWSWMQPMSQHAKYNTIRWLPTMSHFARTSGHRDVWMHPQLGKTCAGFRQLLAWPLFWLLVCTITASYRPQQIVGYVQQDALNGNVPWGCKGGLVPDLQPATFKNLSIAWSSHLGQSRHFLHRNASGIILCAY